MRLVLLVLGLSSSSFASPMAKTEGWVNNWENPRTIRQAKIVAVGAVAVVGLIFVLNWASKRKEQQRRG